MPILKEYELTLNQYELELVEIAMDKLINDYKTKKKYQENALYKKRLCILEATKAQIETLLPKE